MKLNGIRSFLACYEANIYAISTEGKEIIIKSSIRGCEIFMFFHTEVVGDMYYAFDIIILHGLVVDNQSLKERIKR